MNDAAPHDGLPRWWRRTLVALMTLILCSCQALVPPRNASDEFADDLTVVVGDSPPRSIPADFVVESRPLQAEELVMPQLAARPGDLAPATAGCACCGGTSDACAPENLVGPGDEYLCDGGDFGLPAAVRADWTVDGLEPEDAVAHYDTLDGRVVVTPSNRVCVYAPRFAAVRRVEGLQAQERLQLIDIAADGFAPAHADDAQPPRVAKQRHAVLVNRSERPANLFRGREQPGQMVNLQAAMDTYSSLGLYANLQVVRTGEVVGSETAKLQEAIQSAITWTGDQQVQVVFENKQAVAVLGLKQPGQVYQIEGPHDPRLRLLKLASTYHALPGEEVEFTLRVDNVGDQVIGNITIVDNLTTRLEYVADSARSTLDGDFSSTPNGTGSTIIRWEIESPLEPGEGGILQFKCRVK